MLDDLVSLVACSLVAALDRTKQPRCVLSVRVLFFLLLLFLGSFVYVCLLFRVVVIAVLYRLVPSCRQHKF